MDYIIDSGRNKLVDLLLRSHSSVESFGEGKFVQGGQGVFNIRLV